MLIQIIILIVVMNITKNKIIRIILITIGNLAILSSNFGELKLYISQSFNTFKGNQIVINIIIFYLLVYGINEILNFTNIGTSIDGLLRRFKEKPQKLLLLFFSTLSTNFDFSNSKIINDKNFYNNGFLASSFNLISLLSIEILLIIIFINSNQINVWYTFFILNFFVFIWFGKKIIDILNNNPVDFEINKRFYGQSKDSLEEPTKFTYDEKFYITKKKLLLILTINILFVIVGATIFGYYLIVGINLFLFIFFIELLIYILVIIYYEDHLEEMIFYSRMINVYKNSFSHLLLILLSIIFLKTNTFLYSSFINSNHIFTWKTFIIVLLFVLIVTILCDAYTTTFSYIFPLTLIIFNNSIILFSFYLSLILILFFYKNINPKSYNLSIYLELIMIIFGGIISYILYINVNIYAPYIFILIYLTIFAIIYKPLLSLKKGNPND